MTVPETLAPPAHVADATGTAHYKSNVRDIEFNLFEVLGLEQVLAAGAFGDIDGDTVRTMLDEASRLAEGPVAASFADADRNPPRFDLETHTVVLPESLVNATRAWRDAGWPLLGLSAELGGVPAPRVVMWAVNEFLLGAQPAAMFYLMGPVGSEILHQLGTDEQRQWAKVAVEREWAGTMVLTESDAGSDVGAARTRAIERSDGTWHIEGVKRFITSGDCGDLAENILHLVLARPEGAGPGTKGLSLFVVPKRLFDPQTGELGERNGVFATNLERKMGLKASATCELAFGAHGVPATGWLVGGTHGGISQMFRVIEHARMLVGTKAIATLSTGYLNALQYAKERVQGADLARAADKTAPRVTIINHPDVRRSLMTQKAYAEGLRALYLYTAAHQDAIAAEVASGADPQLAVRVNDLLLPVVKGVGSERAYQVLAEALQTLGGSGYMQDYPVEQYIRDAKIDSVYEGTTAIQAQDFFFRKIVRDRGEAIGHVLRQVQQLLDSRAGGGALAAERELLSAALVDVEAMLATLTSRLMATQEDTAEIYKVGLGLVPFLLAFGDLMVGWLLLSHAAIARGALDLDPAAPDVAFYEGKVAVASYFATTFLPTIGATRAAVEGIDGTVMSLSEASF